MNSGPSRKGSAGQHFLNRIEPAFPPCPRGRWYGHPHQRPGHRAQLLGGSQQYPGQNGAENRSEIRAPTVLERQQTRGQLVLVRARGPDSNLDRRQTARGGHLGGTHRGAAKHQSTATAQGGTGRFADRTAHRQHHVRRRRGPVPQRRTSSVQGADGPGRASAHAAIQLSLGAAAPRETRDVQCAQPAKAVSVTLSLCWAHELPVSM